MASFFSASRSHQLIFILDAFYSSSSRSRTSSVVVCASAAPCNQQAYTAMSEPVSGHAFLTTPCVFFLYNTHTHSYCFQRPLGCKRHPQPFHFIWPASAFVIACCSRCVVNMSNKKQNYGHWFAMFTREKLRAFDLLALSSRCGSTSPRHRASCLILSNSYRSLLPRDGSQAASFADSH